MPTIKQDFTALKTSAKTWFDDYQVGISDLDARTNDALYQNLGELFAFHKTWTKDDAAKKSYETLFNGHYVTDDGKEAGTNYGNLIKLVFFPSKEDAFDYRSNITKWAGAISELNARKSPPTTASEMTTNLKKDGIAKLYKSWTVRNKKNGGNTTDKVADGKTALAKIGGVGVTSKDLNKAELKADTLTCPHA